MDAIPNIKRKVLEHLLATKVETKECGIQFPLIQDGYQNSR